MEQYGCVPVTCEVVCCDDDDKENKCEDPPEDPCATQDPCKPDCCCPKQETEIVIVAVEEVSLIEENYPDEKALAMVISLAG